MGLFNFKKKNGMGADNAEIVNSLLGKCFMQKDTGVCFKIIRAGDGSSYAIVENNYGRKELNDFKHCNFDDGNRSFHDSLHCFESISEEEYETECANAKKRFYELKPDDVFFSKTSSAIHDVTMAVVKCVYTFNDNDCEETHIIIDELNLSSPAPVIETRNMSFESFDRLYTKDNENIAYIKPGIEGLVEIIKNKSLQNQTA